MAYRSLTSRLNKLESAQPTRPVVIVWVEDAESVSDACEAALHAQGLPPGTAARFVFVVWEDAAGPPDTA